MLQHPQANLENTRVALASFFPRPVLEEALVLEERGRQISLTMRDWKNMPVQTLRAWT